VVPFAELAHKPLDVDLGRGCGRNDQLFERRIERLRFLDLTTNVVRD